MTSLTQQVKMRITREQKIYLIKEAERQKIPESKIVRNILQDHISKTNTNQLTNKI